MSQAIRIKPFTLAAALALVPLFVASARAEDAFRFPTAKHGPAELKYVDGLPVMLLQGTPEQMGEQHAALVAVTVKPMLEFPRTILKQHGYGKAWPLVVGMSRILIRNGPERFQREMDAAMRQAKVDGNDEGFDAVYVGNAMIELRRMGGCSSMIVGPQHSATGGTLFGRNLDFPTMGLLHKYSLVTVYRPQGRHAFVSIGFPGLFGVTSGMNDAGLALATNDVYSSADGSPMFNPEGAPLGLTFRQILEECTTVAEAEKLLREAKRTTWMNLAVCDRTGGAVFELTPANVAVRQPREHCLTCTNHFCSPKLSTGSVCSRMERLERLWMLERPGVPEVAKLLDAVNQDEYTIQTMVFEPAELKLHLAIGEPPTSKKPLTELDLRPFLRPAPSGAGRSTTTSD